MKSELKYIGILLAIVLGCFNTSGILASEIPSASSSEKKYSNESIEAPKKASSWFLHEISQPNPITPNYSENLSFANPFAPGNSFSFSEIKNQLEKAPVILQRDLKAFTSIQVFPSHFFL